MTAPAFPLGSVCPACGTTVLDRVNISAWQGSTICMYCRSDLDTPDAADARRAITQHLTRVTLHLTPREDA